MTESMETSDMRVPAPPKLERAGVAEAATSEPAVLLSSAVAVRPSVCDRCVLAHELMVLAPRLAKDVEIL